MTRGLLSLAAFLALTGCSAAAKVKVTPLRDQSVSQIEADRARCNEWAQRTTNATVGYAACMISAGYEAPSGVRSTSQRVRLTRKPTTNESIIVLSDFLECDSQAQRKAESGFGMTRKLIRDSLGWSLGTADKRRQLFVECLEPRGYDIAKN